MMKYSGWLKPALALILTASLFSCASSRYQEGFSYRPAFAGPDMGEGTNVENGRSVGREENVEQPVVSAEIPAPAAGNLTEEQSLFVKEMAAVAVRESEKGEGESFKGTVRKMASSYAEKHDVVFTEKQLKKLDRIAVKMEKKQMRQQGPNVQWGPANNLEWAILGAAAVGLFVGIFGVGFGWFVFLIAALAYLFFKLLHNN